MNSVIKTYEQAIASLTAERDNTNAMLGDVTTRCENLRAEIAGIDADLEDHYAQLGRMHFRTITAARAS